MSERGFEGVKAEFEKQTELRKEKLNRCKEELDHVFVFLEEAFGSGQELVWFVTELTGNYHTSRFISHFGCEKYFYYSKELLLVEKDLEIQKEIDEVKDLLPLL